DSTSNAYNGAVVNSPTATAGKLGGAVSLVAASSQYIVLPNAVNTGNNVTISGWMKVSSASANPLILDTRDNGTLMGCVLYMDSSTGYANWYCNNTLNQAGSANLKDGAWHYYAGVLQSGGIQSLYVDGQRVATASVSGFIGFTGGSAEIGAVRKGSPFTNGQVDEVR